MSAMIECPVWAPAIAADDRACAVCAAWIAQRRALMSNSR